MQPPKRPKRSLPPPLPDWFPRGAALLRDPTLNKGTAFTEAEREEGVSDRDRVTLGLIALAGHEKDLIDQGFASGLMSSKTYEQARTVAERLLETTRSGGPSGTASPATCANGLASAAGTIAS